MGSSSREVPYMDLPNSCSLIMFLCFQVLNTRGVCKGVGGDDPALPQYVITPHMRDTYRKSRNTKAPRMKATMNPQ